MNEANASDGPPPIAVFSAWVWLPDVIIRSRGFATSKLIVLPHRLLVRSSRLGSKSGSATDLDYEWPTVVVERHRPVPDAGLLVDIGGKLGRVAVRGRTRNLVAAIDAAGFRVVVVSHYGWEAPRPVLPSEASLSQGEVPGCVVGRPSGGPRPH